MDVHLVLQVWTHPGFWTEIEPSIWTNMGVMFLLHPVRTENAEHSPSDSMISWHHAASWISSARMDTCGPAGASQQHTCLNTPTCVRVSIHKNTLNTHTPFEHSALDICMYRSDGRRISVVLVGFASVWLICKLIYVYMFILKAKICIHLD